MTDKALRLPDSQSDHKAFSGSSFFVVVVVLFFVDVMFRYSKFIPYTLLTAS